LATTNDPAILIPTLLERCMNNARTVDVVINKFEKQANDAIAQIKQHITTSDLTAIARVAHSLKGAAGILAANQLATLAGQMEQLGRNGEVAQLGSQFASLQAEITRCIDQLPQVRSIAAEKLSSRASSPEVKS
jgi:HPt (histidine-containing phosphotransfer) domain-containing protein